MAPTTMPCQMPSKGLLLQPSYPRRTLVRTSHGLAGDLTPRLRTRLGTSLRLSSRRVLARVCARPARTPVVRSVRAMCVCSDLAPDTQLNLRSEIARISRLVQQILDPTTVRSQRKSILLSDGDVMARYCAVEHLAKSEEERDVLAAVAAAGQTHVFDTHNTDGLAATMQVLLQMEEFYDNIGGVLGYQVEALTRIANFQGLECENEDEGCVVEDDGPDAPWTEHHVPQGLDLVRDDGSKTQEAVLSGIRAVPHLAEIYPLGGAGDRLGLVDEVTGESLPVAMLPYAGRTLLEGMLRDLQAREYLHWQLFGEQHVIPVAVMTSDAKGNAERVREILEELSWYGRGEESFRLFKQPMVPVVSAADAQWVTSGRCHLVLKPGGHGVIWKLAQDKGVLSWLINEYGRKAAVVRQISNPLAATNTTMLSLTGIGWQSRKPFGFASCERKVGAAEGVNVMVEKYVGSGIYKYGASNIEYTEFDKLGIVEQASDDGNGEAQLSKFPANTNVLYVDLEAVDEAISTNPDAAFPGLTLNLKKDVKFVDCNGQAQAVRGGRLESTMQNIADELMEVSDTRLSAERHASFGPFVVFNKRRHVTSSAKRKRDAGSLKLSQTPDGSFLDLQRNSQELLNICGFETPEQATDKAFIDHGPTFIFMFHPSLGPLWDVIKQKLRGGTLQRGSEVVLDAAEANVEQLSVEGSLVVQAKAPLGSLDSDGRLVFNGNKGRVWLENVSIQNKGIDWSHKTNTYWQHRVHRQESCSIVLHGNSSFVATNVTIPGDHSFEVPDGHIMTVSQGDSPSEIRTVLAPLDEEDSWQWSYSLDGTTIRCKIEKA